MRYTGPGGGVLRSKAASPFSVVRLQVNSGDYNDQTLLVFGGSRAKTGIDDGDVEKVTNSLSYIPELYTLADNAELALNKMPVLTANMTIPLGFRSGRSGNFSISATEVTNLPAGMRVILKDDDLEHETDLTNGESYRFSSGVTDNTERFSIIFVQGGGTATPNTDGSSRIVYSDGNGSAVIANSEGCTASIYDLLGRKIAERKITGSRFVFDSLPSNVYIVKLQNADINEVFRITVK
jgi:hypothetical protein